MPATHATRVQYATDSTFQDLVLESTQPVLVDFYADWCGPCQRLAAVLEELAAENPQASIVKVNVDQCPGLAQRYRIERDPQLEGFQRMAELPTSRWDLPASGNCRRCWPLERRAGSNMKCGEIFLDALNDYVDGETRSALGQALPRALGRLRSLPNRG